MTEIEVTMLGTTAGVPTKHRNHPAVYLRYKGREEWVGLFDCGEGTQKQIFTAGLNFMRISDIFISHWHADHFAGLLGLMFTMNMEDRKEVLNVFAPEADRWVYTITGLGYGKLCYKVEAKNVEYEGSEIETLLDTEEFKVLAIPAKHGVPACAYAFIEKDRVKLDVAKLKAMGLPERNRAYQTLKDKGAVTIKGKTIKLNDVAIIEPGKKVVYTGDTLPCQNVIRLAENADLLIHDTTFFEEDVAEDKRHAVLDDVLKVAEQAKVKKLLLTHISRRYQNLEEIEKHVKHLPNVMIARDFMTLKV